MPPNIFAAKEGKTVSGCKVLKESRNVLSEINAHGELNLKWMLTYHCENLRAFNNDIKSSCLYFINRTESAI